MQSSIVNKLLLLLTTISETQKPMTFSEIVKKTGLNKSTIHRLLSLGIEERLVWFDQHRKAYLLGDRVFDLVRNAHHGYDIQAVSLDEMVRLYELFDANVTIGVPNGLEVVYLRILESRNSMGSVQRPGTREPVHCSASGKALFAFFPEKILETQLNGYEFTRFTDRTVQNAEEFKTELNFVRANGYGKNDREEYENFLGIAAPVFNYLGDPIAVLNIWTTYPRHKVEDLMEWSEELRASAQRVTRMIGGITPELEALDNG